MSAFPQSLGCTESGWSEGGGGSKGEPWELSSPELKAWGPLDRVAPEFPGSWSRFEYEGAPFLLAPDLHPLLRGSLRARKAERESAHLCALLLG